MSTKIAPESDRNDECSSKKPKKKNKSFKIKDVDQAVAGETGKKKKKKGSRKRLIMNVSQTKY